MPFDCGRGVWFTALLSGVLLAGPVAAEANAPTEPLAPAAVYPPPWLGPGSGTERSVAPASPPRQQWLQEVRQVAIRHLTTALEHAYQSHIERAQPLPAAVREFLAPLFPADILERARYAVSQDELTLPSVLNQTHKALFGQDHAVSVDHLIVFSRDPGLERASDAHWWAHELAHHLQYRRLGSIEAFAAEYVRDFQAIEQEAEKWGQEGARKYIDERVLGRRWQRPSQLAGIDLAHEDVPEGQEQRSDQRTDHEAVEPEQRQPTQR